MSYAVTPDSDFNGDRADRNRKAASPFEHTADYRLQSKKQLLVATSTTEVEYVSSSKPTRMTRCLIQLIGALGGLVTIPIYLGSNGALKDIWSGVSSADQAYRYSVP